MQKKTKKNVSPRVFEETQGWYAEHFNSINAGCEYILEAFPELYSRTINDLRGKFTRGELMLFIDVMNAHFYNPRGAGLEMGLNVADGMALDQLDEKWEIPDKWALNKKLADLHNFDRACLEIWIQGFWAQDDHSNIKEYVAALIAK